MVAPAIIAAGIGAASNLLGGMMGNSASSKEARKNRQWQEYMSNTAHYREVRDLHRAGLNPMLSVMGGSGASTPSGAVAHQENPLKGVGDLIADAVPKSALVAQTEANIDKTKADTLKSIADTELSTAQAAEAKERTTTYAPNIQKVLSDSALSSVQYNKVLTEIGQLEKQGRLTEANIKQSLASAGLTNAQIAEVQPRINNLIANTMSTNASIGSKEILGLPGNMLRELLSNSADSPSSSTVGGKISSGVSNSAKSFRQRAIENRNAYDKKHNLKYSR